MGCCATVSECEPRMISEW